MTPRSLFENVRLAPFLLVGCALSLAACSSTTTTTTGSPDPGKPSGTGTDTSGGSGGTTDTTDTSDAGATSSSAGNPGGTITCAPWSKYTDVNASCASGCASAQAADQRSLWCLKRCTDDSDCAGGDLPGSCQPGTEPGNPTVCVPVCASSSLCSSSGFGSTCQTLHSPAYCSGGPAFLF